MCLVSHKKSYSNAPQTKTAVPRAEEGHRRSDTRHKIDEKCLARFITRPDSDLRPATLHARPGTFKHSSRPSIVPADSKKAISTNIRAFCAKSEALKTSAAKNEAHLHKLLDMSNPNHKKTDRLLSLNLRNYDSASRALNKPKDLNPGHKHNATVSSVALKMKRPKAATGASQSLHKHAMSTTQTLLKQGTAKPQIRVSPESRRNDQKPLEREKQPKTIAHSPRQASKEKRPESSRTTQLAWSHVKNASLVRPAGNSKPPSNAKPFSLTKFLSSRPKTTMSKPAAGKSPSTASRGKHVRGSSDVPTSSCNKKAEKSKKRALTKKGSTGATSATDAAKSVAKKYATQPAPSAKRQLACKLSLGHDPTAKQAKRAQGKASPKGTKTTATTIATTNSGKNRDDEEAAASKGKTVIVESLGIPGPETEDNVRAEEVKESDGRKAEEGGKKKAPDRGELISFIKDCKELVCERG